MPKSRAYGGLDAFRILAALLVVAIHISPLTTYSAAGDFFLTRCLARVAVPFFFMVTGHFVLGQVLEGKGTFAPLGRQVRKILLLYLVAVVLYLPIGWYAGHYQDLRLLDGVRLLVFDGTFYHLWYFPACAMGLLVVYGLSRVFRGRGLWVAVGMLYAIALLGDSYYGLTAQIAPLASLYEAGFHLFSYTRNGLFMAPLFLLLGAQMGKRGPAPLPWAAGLGLAFSLALMTGEGFLLRHLGLQRHDSMYLLLPLVMCFLYRLLLAWPAKAPAACRTLSTWVYILHPAMLVVLRGGAKVVGLTEILVGNSLVQYLMVCLLSFLAAGVVTWVLGRLGCRVFSVDKAELAPQVAAMPGVNHCLGSGFGLEPRHVGQVDWLFSDMICYPDRLLETVQEWLAADACRNVVCTLKFQAQTDHETARAFAAIPGGRLLHLSCNKHELTFVKLAD